MNPINKHVNTHLIEHLIIPPIAKIVVEYWEPSNEEILAYAPGILKYSQEECDALNAIHIHVPSPDLDKEENKSTKEKTLQSTKFLSPQRAVKNFSHPTLQIIKMELRNTEKFAWTLYLIKIIKDIQKTQMDTEQDLTATTRPYITIGDEFTCSTDEFNKLMQENNEKPGIAFSKHITQLAINCSLIQ
jgi:hypothetical protein